jgi:cytochrome b6-f complex iron-sulfur subunit
MELPSSDGTATVNAGEHADERRDFIKTVAVGTLALGVVGTIAEASRFLKPNVLYEPSRVFRVGEVGSFPIDSRTVIEGRGVQIVRERDGIHAISLVCTHLGCLLRPVENDSECGYTCPCHGSRFTTAGQVLRGPAPRDLPWYEVYVDVTGNLVVDTSKVNEARTKLVV